MLSILSLLLVVCLSILITRTASIALTHTGLSEEAARFQARSAFTGAGFTTNESEKVVNHPVRRRIVLLLMLLGNAGIVTAVSSLILAFVRQDAGEGMGLATKVGLLIAGLLVLWALSSSRFVDRRLSRLIDRLLKRYTRLDVRDYSALLRLTGEYRLGELAVEHGDWMAGKSLGELRLRDEGVVVLGIQRMDGTYLGTPDGDSTPEPDDVLLVYAREPALKSLDERRRGWTGDQEHAEAVEEQAEVAKEEVQEDER